MDKIRRKNGQFIKTVLILVFLVVFIVGYTPNHPPLVMISVQSNLSSIQWERLNQSLNQAFPSETDKQQLITMLKGLTSEQLRYFRDQIRMSHLIEILPLTDLQRIFGEKGLTILHDDIHIQALNKPLLYRQLPYGLNSLNGKIRLARPTRIAVHGINSPLAEWQEYVQQLIDRYPEDNLLLYKYDYGGNPWLISGSLRQGLAHLIEQNKIQNISILAHSLGGFVTYGALQAEAIAYIHLDATGDYLKDNLVIQRASIQFTTIASPLKGSWALDLDHSLWRLLPSYHHPYWISASEILAGEGTYMQYIRTHSLLNNVIVRRVINVDDDLTSLPIFPPHVQEPDQPLVLKKHMQYLRGSSHELAPVGYLYWQILSPYAPQAHSLPELFQQLPLEILVRENIDMKLVFRMLRENNNPLDNVFTPIILSKIIGNARFQEAIADELTHMTREETWTLIEKLGYIQDEQITSFEQRNAIHIRLRHSLNIHQRQRLLSRLRGFRDPHNRHPDRQEKIRRQALWYLGRGLEG